MVCVVGWGWLVAVVVSTGTSTGDLFFARVFKNRQKVTTSPLKMFLTTLLLTATAVTAAPVFLYSHDASLLAGRNHYVDRGFTTKELFALHQTQDPLVFNKSPASASASSPSLLSLILVTEEPTDTFATSDNWLKQQYTAAPSSVVLPRYVHDNALAVAATQNEEVYSFKGTNYQHLARQIAQTLLDVPTTRTIVVPVQSLQNTGEFVDVGEFIIFYIFWGSSHRTHHFLLSSPPTEHIFHELIQGLEQTYSLVVVVTSKTNVAPLNVEAMLAQHLPHTTPPPLQHRSAGRKMLEDTTAPAASKKTILVGVHNSPGLMGGLLSGVFLSMTLWIAVTCLASVESAPMMVNAPPGPKEGDPQFIGTPREGTRYYPYRNQPVKEQ